MRFSVEIAQVSYAIILHKKCDINIMQTNRVDVKYSPSSNLSDPMVDFVFARHYNEISRGGRRIVVVGQYNESYYPVMDGVVTTVENYARWLNEKHCRCFVVTPKVPRYIDEKPFEVVRYRSMPVVGRRPYRTGFPSFDGQLRRFERTQPIDLVHAHSPFFAGHEALRLGRKRGIPVVATFHSKFYDDFLEATKSPFLARKLLRYVIRFFEDVDYVWTVNESTAQTLREYGYRGDVEIMPNGVDYPKFDDSQTLCPGRFRTSFGLSSQVPLFLFVGQQIWQKNIETLLKAVALYKKTGAPFKLALIGEGKAKAEIIELTRTLGLIDEVLFTGAISDRTLLAEAYLSAKLFVFPSLYDNAPLVVREAACFGLPPVLVKSANAAEGVTHGENGFLCENTPEDLCRVLQDAMRDETRRAQIGEHARQTIPISWEAVVARAYERYTQIVEMHREKRRG